MSAFIDITDCPTFKYDINSVDMDTLWDMLKKYSKYKYLISLIPLKT